MDFHVSSCILKDLRGEALRSLWILVCPHVYLEICRDSTAFAGHQYNAARTPDGTWGCARMVSRGVAAKHQESFAAIAHLGPMQERGDEDTTLSGNCSRLRRKFERSTLTCDK